MAEVTVKAVSTIILVLRMLHTNLTLTGDGVYKINTDIRRKRSRRRRKGRRRRGSKKKKQRRREENVYINRRCLTFPDDLMPLLRVRKTNTQAKSRHRTSSQWISP